jgi:hypothetical protein
VDTARPFGDDLDLDALMLRVRDAAMAGAPGRGPVRPQASGDGDSGELDVIKVLEAQGEWNEQARLDLVALVDAIRALRDDWNEVHAALRQEVTQLTTIVDELRVAATGPAARPGASGNTRSRTRRAAASPRTNKRRSAGGRRPRS